MTVGPDHVSFGYSPVMRDADTSGGRTRQSVIPQPLSRASARPSGSNEESASRYRSRTGLPPSNVTRPERGSISNTRLREAARGRIGDVVDRPERTIEELVLVHREPVGPPRPQERRPGAARQRSCRPSPDRRRADALEQRTARELLEPVLAPPDRPDGQDPEAEDEQREDERIAPRDEEKRRGERDRRAPRRRV